MLGAVGKVLNLIMLIVLLTVGFVLITGAMAIPYWAGMWLLLAPWGIRPTYEQAFGILLVLNTLVVPWYLLFAAAKLRERKDGGT